NVDGMLHLVQEVARHCQTGDTADAVLGRPQTWRVTRQLKFLRPLSLEPLNIGVNAVGEVSRNLLDAGTVGGPLRVPIATEVDRPRQQVALDCPGSENFSELASPSAPP